jgi:hypothetical protein
MLLRSAPKQRRLLTSELATKSSLFRQRRPAWENARKLINKELLRLLRTQNTKENTENLKNGS